MPFPTVTVPRFPNVPNVPGVPAVLRSALGAQNLLTGTLQGVLDARSGVVTGSLVGFLTQSSGQVGAIVGTVRGVLDDANNFSGALTGALGGNLTGALTGVIDRVTGVVQAGVSGVLSQLTGSLGSLTGDGAAVTAQAAPFQWGIFTAGGAPVLTGDNVFAVTYARDYRVATFPVERGSFESYNKVEQPIDLMLTFTKGGTVAERGTFLAMCDIAQTSLELYSVATPEATYTEMNVVHIAYDRTAASGATLLRVDVGLQRVRAYATATFTNTKSPDGTADVNAGPVQAVPPTPTQAGAVTAAVARSPIGPPV